jgi:putative endonuclease
LVFGREGEAAAARFLQAAGFRVLRRNFRARGGEEIDLICRDQDVLVFVEVKARATEEFGRPLTAVDRKKRRLLVRAAMAWLRMLSMPDVAFRFDVVEVVSHPPEIRHIKNAFNLPAPYQY